MMNTSTATTNDDLAVQTVMRRVFLVIFLIGTIGAGAELILADHTEGWRQLLPLWLMASSFIVLAYHAARPGAASVRIFQSIMLLFGASGFAGVWLHYQARVEFKAESDPALHGLNLFWEAVTGATMPPVLAPGMMIQLGLLGLAYTFRHPALDNSTKRKNSQLLEQPHETA